MTKHTHPAQPVLGVVLRGAPAEAGPPWERVPTEGDPRKQRRHKDGTRKNTGLHSPEPTT